jgi:hypothetical protein
MSVVKITAGSFRLECEMFDPVLASIPSLFPAPSCATRVVREAVVGNVIPDLLIGQWCAEASSSVPSMTNVARHVVALLQRSGSAAPAELIEEELYLSSSALTRAITLLKRLGALSCEAPEGELQLAPEFAKATQVKLIAVEMKMTRWREALNQAIRYLDFADEAYVVLDGNQITLTDEIIKAFELSAPGLYIQRGAAHPEKVLDACPVPSVPSADRLLAIHKVLHSGPHCFA